MSKSYQIPVEHNGEILTLKEWAKILGCEPQVLATRYKRGLRGDRLFASVRKYEKQPKSVVLSDSTYQRLQFHMQRLDVTEAELVEKIFEVMLKRLDSHAIEQTKQSLSSGE